MTFKSLYLVIFVGISCGALEAAADSRGEKRTAEQAGLEDRDSKRQRILEPHYTLQTHEGAEFPFMKLKNTVDYCITCLKNGEEKVGALGCYKNEKKLSIELLYVLPAYRSKGIGGMLIDAAIEMARQHNIKSLRLDASPFEVEGGSFGPKNYDLARKRLIKWYEERGFVCEKEKKPYYEIYDSVMMEKVL